MPIKWSIKIYIREAYAIHAKYCLPSVWRSQWIQYIFKLQVYRKNTLRFATEGGMEAVPWQRKSVQEQKKERKRTGTTKERKRSETKKGEEACRNKKEEEACRN